MDVTKTEEFRIIRETIYKLNYGKWWKCFAARFSWCHLLKYIGLYSLNMLTPTLLAIISIYFPSFYDSQFLHSHWFIPVLYVLGYAIPLLTFFYISSKYYSIYEIVPETVKLIEDNYYISRRNLEYKLFFSPSIRYHRLAFLIGFIVTLCLAFILIKPMPLLILLAGGYKYLDPKSFGGDLYTTIVISHANVSMATIEHICLQFILFEIIILAPFILKFIKSRLVHIVAAFCFFGLYGQSIKYLRIGFSYYHWAFLGIVWIAVLIARDLIIRKYSVRLKR